MKGKIMKQQIPQIIHYCWFGPNELPETERKCIESWKTHLPNYQIMLWNEKNFDINSVHYVKQAYELKKYAFVSDYVRFKVLYEYGGIYLDTDQEILKNLDKYLQDDIVLGFENRTMIAMGLIGAVAGHTFIRDVMEYYQTHNFVEGGVLDTTTIVQIVTKILVDRGFSQENRDQIIDGIHLYERDYFYPKLLDEGKFAITDRTVAIHHGSASWLTVREKKRGRSKVWRNICRPILKKTRVLFNRIFGEKCTRRLETKFRTMIR